jgi:hypothetical protein
VWPRLLYSVRSNPDREIALSKPLVAASAVCCACVVCQSLDIGQRTWSPILHIFLLFFCSSAEWSSWPHFGFFDFSNHPFFFSVTESRHHMDLFVASKPPLSTAIFSELAISSYSVHSLHSSQLRSGYPSLVAHRRLSAGQRLASYRYYVFCTSICAPRSLAWCIQPDEQRA